ncbi:MAG: M20 family metallopeptidase [Desulfovibrionales bacterium]
MPVSKSDLHEPRGVVSAFIQEQRKALFSLLRDLVEIQSGSRNLPGLKHMARRCAEELGTLPLDVTTVEMPGHGALVRATNTGSVKGPPSLIIGHMDTVFPADTHFDSYREDEERAFGPGVYDMKGGLVAAIFALRALDRAGMLSRVPVTIVFNPDEEIGSPASGQIIREEARRSARGFVLEGGGVGGEVVTGRKGKLGFELEVRGRAGHAGNVCRSKASAVLELAHKTIGLEGLNDPPDWTVNVGRVEGGIGPNTVADHARALVDARALTPEGLEGLRARIETLVAAPSVPDTSCRLSVNSTRPTMPRSERNLALFELAREEAGILGIELGEEVRSGVSDANLVSDESLPVLDGLGPVGDLDHSDREYIIKDSLPQRAALFALILRRCSE